MHATPMSAANPVDEALEAVLRPIHEGWLEEARRFLDPALDPRAEFRTRWATVRYLNDEFLDRFRWELAIVDELRPFLAADTSERLRCESARLARLRLEFDRIGRRRGTAAEVAAASDEREGEPAERSPESSACATQQWRQPADTREAACNAP